MLDFCALILIPVAVLKRHSPSERMSASRIEPSQKISISSTKSKWVRVSPFKILIPVNLPPNFAPSRKRLSPSATRRKSKGERGHPCRRPLSA
jgi:hypothetical protein